MKKRLFKRIVAFMVSFVICFSVIITIPCDYLPNLVAKVCAAEGDYLDIENYSGQDVVNIGEKVNLTVYLNDSDGNMKYTSYSNYAWEYIYEDIHSVDETYLYCSSDYGNDILSLEAIPLKSGKYTLNISYGNNISSSYTFVALNQKEIIASGGCGYYTTDISWNVNNSSVLSFLGHGNMESFGFSHSTFPHVYDSRAPWHYFWNYITKIAVGDGITSIGSYAFYNCAYATTISLPDSITSIYDAAFYKCRNLTKITLPRNLTYIGNNAFGGTSITEIVIPDEVTRIENYAFLSCVNLKKVTIPKDTILGVDVFDGCSDDLTIYGYENSSAEEYAIENNIPFVALDSSESLDKSYTVKWVNDNGTTIYTEEVNVGEHPTYNAEKWGTPISSTGNEFKGWANIPETENNIVIPVFSSTDTSYTGNGGDITYYAIYGDFVNVKWYNGNTLLEDNYCKENTVPKYGGEMPKCYDYEYGLVREFLGWTTADNSKYDITIPDVIKPVKQDTVYYAVFSDKDPDVNVTEAEVYDIHYINQHIESANNRLWDIASLSSQNKVVFESNPTEFANGLWSGTEVAVDVINLDIFGLVDKVSANDYNIIMLDMFASVENMELAEKTFNDSILKAVKENTKFLKQVCSVEGLAFSDQKSLLGDIDYAYSEYLKAVELNDSNGLFNYCNKIQQVIKKYEIEDVDISKIDNFENLLKPYHAFSEISGIVGDISTAAGTFKSYSDNIMQILSSEAYVYMDDVYRELLIDMYHEADKYNGNSWEIRDLKNAIVYALNYNDNYKKTAILSTINGTSYELAKLIFGTNTLDKPNSLNKESVSKRIQSFFVNKGTDFINNTFGSEVSSATIGSYLAGLQVGSKLGMYISDSLFDTSSRHDMYIKIKEYGVLEDVMKSVLDKRANELLNATSLEAQHNAAQKYDRAYKMYFAIEIMGSDNIAAYEKSLIPSSVSAAIQKWMGTDTIYKVLYNESLDKAVLRHAANYTDYKNYSESLSKYPCHNDIFINENNYIDIMLKYNMHIENYKISIISCPVNILVYDENKQLVGNLSSEMSNVKKGYEIYMYRIDETDSSVVVVPSNYSIEIVGLDDGTMTLIGGYCKNGALVNAVSYNNVPIDNNYAAKFDIDENTSNLSEITPTSPSQPILSVPTTDNNSNQENTNTYEDVSSGAGIYELFEDKKEPFCMIVIIIAAIGFLSIIIIKRFSKNKQ